MTSVKFAGLRFKDDKHKNYYKPIDYIFHTKGDKCHITPSDYEDYDEKHKYYVYWSSCNNNCKVTDNCCSFYKAYIVSLGGTYMYKIYLRIFLSQNFYSYLLILLILF